MKKKEVLKKRVCIRCHKTFDWQFDDEDRGLWRTAQMVYCPEGAAKELKHGITDIDRMPDHCPFKLEHLVIN